MSSPLGEQEKLDRLFEKGYLRKSEIDQVLLDDIESERAAGLPVLAQFGRDVLAAASGRCALCCALRQLAL